MPKKQAKEQIDQIADETNDRYNQVMEDLVNRRPSLPSQPTMAPTTFTPSESIGSSQAYNQLMQQSDLGKSGFVPLEKRPLPQKTPQQVMQESAQARALANEFNNNSPPSRFNDLKRKMGR